MRELKISLIISFSFHLIGMLAVVPVLTPERVRTYSTEISFLGSILERVSIAQSRYPILDIKEIGLGADKRSIEFSKPEALGKVKEELGKEEALRLQDTREDFIVSMHYKKEKDRFRIKFDGLIIKGEAKNRLLLYKPDISGRAFNLSTFDRDYHVNIRFKISRHGLVEQPECMISSGSSYIDRFAIQYVRKWQFVPLHENSDAFQEGVVRLSFTNGAI
ncbi:MAG: TonB family protein [Candidatus Omnitrophota bacterium]